MVYCKKCGKNNSKGKFCSGCGSELVKRVITNQHIILGSAVLAIILAIIEAIAFLQATDAENIFGDVKRGTMLLMGIEFCGNNKCSPDEIYSCKKDCVWCGDGTCQQEELSSCYDDCEWCGDGYCQNKENCNSCSKDCGNCKEASYCGDGICNPGECNIGCMKDCSISECENGLCEEGKGENCVVAPNDCRCKLNEKCNRGTKSCDVVLCGNGKCDDGENLLNCPNDCKEKYSEVLSDLNKDFPITFVHGHSVLNEQVSTYSLNAFIEFQDKLESDGLYKDMGVILPNSDISAFSEGEWGRYDNPISVRTTYYVGTLDSSGVFIRADETERSINEYGQRLGQVVDIVLHHTGKSKVIIIAHSMGGLVSRAYVKNYGGASKVDKLITIGTPNHGVYGWLIGGLCENPIYGYKGQECKDMQHDSNFIVSLNNGDETFGSTTYYTIAGNSTYNKGAYADEVVRVESVKLDGAINVVIHANEVPGIESFHSHLILPSKAPQAYNYVKNFLS